MKDTKIISGFPGTGKSYYFVNQNKLSALDSDSSKFDKKYFPQNYIEHIKEVTGTVDIIFVSSHEEVRKALFENDIKFISIYPKIDLKNEYIERYRKRGNPEAFINLVKTNWEEWIQELYTQCYSTSYIRLNRGEYISDIIEKIIKHNG